MPQGPADLHGELIVQAIDQVTDMVGHVAEMEILSPPIAGIEDLFEVFACRHHRIAVGQRAVAEVMNHWRLVVGRHDPPGQFR